jgi:hypothetical protein
LRHNLTACTALTEALEAPLIIRDERLSRAPNIRAPVSCTAKEVCEESKPSVNRAGQLVSISACQLFLGIDGN